MNAGAGREGTGRGNVGWMRVMEGRMKVVSDRTHECEKEKYMEKQSEDEIQVVGDRRDSVQETVTVPPHSHNELVCPGVSAPIVSPLGGHRN